MHQSRRTFLKSSAVAAAAVMAMPGDTFAGAGKLRRTAVQLYSVRDEMNKDPKGTLKKLADMGYTHIEHANYNANERTFYGYKVKDFKALLNDLGLKMPSGHTTMGTNHWNKTTNDFNDDWKRTVEDAAEIGQRYVISPSLWGAKLIPEEMKPYMDQFNKSGELCQKYSMKFAYHNHDFEFRDKVGDLLVYDFMLQNTDPKFVTWQLDIGNMYIAGAKAADYIAKYPGRFESMHVKDMIAKEGEQGKFESCVLGKGIVPVKDILKLGVKKGGTTLFVVEQEEYQGLGQSESVGIDLKIMKKWGY
ncbi:MAG: sugar phosphate isomerase/epimerase [Sphingobacteriaceae bacterium]|nr:MAG: sugar phosphate isomerase/epimerase [Sphingobacteriaceae bacterium]